MATEGEKYFRIKSICKNLSPRDFDWENFASEFYFRYFYNKKRDVSFRVVKKALYSRIKRQRENKKNVIKAMIEKENFKDIEELDTRKLERALNRLGSKQQDLVILSFYQDYSIRQIARLKGVEPQKIRDSLRETLETLRRNLKNGT